MMLKLLTKLWCFSILQSQEKTGFVTEESITIWSKISQIYTILIVLVSTTTISENFNPIKQRSQVSSEIKMMCSHTTPRDDVHDSAYYYYSG